MTIIHLVLQIICPEPVVDCTRPLAQCPGPEVSCPGPISHCSEPHTSCRPPKVTCPKPEIICEKPVPCPETTPPPLVQATCPPNMTECNGNGCPPSIRSSSVGVEEDLPGLSPDVDADSETYMAMKECVGLNKEYGFKWDLTDCKTPRRFICETKPKIDSLNVFNTLSLF
jgi:hypothetical protein